MGVYIPKMEMPKSCLRGGCPIDGESCSLWEETHWKSSDEPYRKLHKNCPLIEVPPHGRLIDADAWIAKVREELLSPHCKKGALEIMGAMFRDVLDAPTIIESEGEDA